MAVRSTGPISRAAPGPRRAPISSNSSRCSKRSPLFIDPRSPPPRVRSPCHACACAARDVGQLRAARADRSGQLRRGLPGARRPAGSRRCAQTAYPEHRRQPRREQRGREGRLMARLRHPNVITVLRRGHRRRRRRDFHGAPRRPYARTGARGPRTNQRPRSGAGRPRPVSRACRRAPGRPGPPRRQAPQRHAGSRRPDRADGFRRRPRRRARAARPLDRRHASVYGAGGARRGHRPRRPATSTAWASCSSSS